MNRSKYWRFIEFVEAHPEFKWDMLWLSQNPSITVKDVIDNPEMGWKMFWLSSNPSITMKNVLDHPNIGWDTYFLSCNSSITMKDVLDHPEMAWDMEGLSYNSSITMRDVLNYPNLAWNMAGLSLNPSITMRDVSSHPEMRWNMGCLSRNPSINMKDVSSHPEMRWNMGCLSTNPSITMKDVLNYPNLAWNIEFLSRNPSITGDDIILYPKFWSKYLSSLNPPITIQDIKSSKIFNMYYMFKKIPVTVNDIIKCHNEGLSHDYISNSPIITMNDIIVGCLDTNVLAKKDYQQYVKEMWNRYLDYIIGLNALDLPVYVVLWILDWIDEYFYFQCLRELTKVRMIEKVKRFREKTIKLR